LFERFKCARKSFDETNAQRVRHRAAKSYTSHRWRREGMHVCVLEKDQEAALASG